MNLRSLFNLIVRPIPAGETAAEERTRRTKDWTVAAVLAAVVVVLLFLGLHLQVTAPAIGLKPVEQDPDGKLAAPEPFEMTLTAPPGADDVPATPRPAPPVPTVRPEEKKEPGDQEPKLDDRVRQEMDQNAVLLQTRIEAEIRTQADALVRSLPPPKVPDLPAAPTVEPLPAPSPAK